MKLFKENITPRLSTLGDKIYPLVVDIKKGVKSGEAVNFVTADNEVGILSIELLNGDEPYDISGCIVCGTIQRPDTSTLNVYCDIVGANKLEIPLGVSGTYQEGVHNFDLKIYRGNEKVIGVPTMSYTVTGSLSSDGVVEGDDRLPVLTMVLDNAHDKLVRLDKAIAGATNDLEVKEARDGEVTLNARLERDLAKGKVHFVDVKGSSIATESQEGYLENVEIYGNTYQDTNNLSDIRSVGTKVEGQELYEIDVVSCGKNLFDNTLNSYVLIEDKTTMYNSFKIRLKPNTTYVIKHIALNKDFNLSKYIGFHKTPNTGNAMMVWLYHSGIGGYQKDSVRNITTDNTGCIYLSFGYCTVEELKLFLSTVQIQLEEGTVATPYEPYQEDKLTILSPTPLEKVGDVADRIICKDGVWGVEKNIKEYTFTGSENIVAWNGAIDSPNTNALVCANLLVDAHINEYAITSISNKLESLINASSVNKADVECFSSRDNVYFRLLKSNSGTLEDAKKYIKGTTIKYQTTKPIFIPLPNNQQIKLRTFVNKTHISFDTEIEPTIKAQVPKSLGATVNTHTTQIDNLNKELDRVKKLEESTVSTVTSDKAFTTVAETTQGYFEDVKIEGKTLVNLAGTKSSAYYLDGQATYDDINKCISINTSTNKYSNCFVKCKDLLKTSTNYTLIVNILENNTDGILALSTSSGNQSAFKTHAEISNIIKGTYKYLLTTKDSFDDNMVGLRAYFNNTTLTAGKVLKFNVVLLEGDHTDKDLSYFEGLKSVGQDSDEISVLSVNNGNLAYNTIIEIGDITTKGENGTRTDRERTKGYIEVLPSSKIYTSPYPVNVYEYDSDYNFIRYTINVDNFKTSSNTKYIRYYQAIGYLSKIILTYSTDFKNQINKQDKKQILYFNPTTQVWEKPILREWDSIEKHDDGKYYYHKRSGEVVLNGSEDWMLNSTFSTDTHTTVQVQVKDAKFKGDSICDMFNNLSNYGQVEGIDIAYQNYIYLSISNTKLSTQDVVGFKAWLQANPVTVVYQLAQGEVYECTNLDLITYSGETNLIVSSGAIQPKLELKVLSNVSNVVKLLQEKVSMLENKFIKGLQQVLAGDMMSLAHLLYPEDFENNHEIQTLEL